MVWHVQTPQRQSDGAAATVQRSVMKPILPSLKGTITVPYSILVYKVYESGLERKGHAANFPPFRG